MGGQSNYIASFVMNWVRVDEVYCPLACKTNLSWPRKISFRGLQSQFCDELGLHWGIPTAREHGGTPPIRSRSTIAPHGSLLLDWLTLKYNLIPQRPYCQGPMGHMRIDQLRSESIKDSMRVTAIEMKSNSLNPA